MKMRTFVLSVSAIFMLIGIFYLIGSKNSRHPSEPQRVRQVQPKSLVTEGTRNDDKLPSIVTLPADPSPSPDAVALDAQAGNNLATDPKKDIDYAEDLKDWDKFYRMVRAMKIWIDEVESLIVGRIAKEHNISDIDKSYLKETLQNECQEISDELIALYGDGDRLTTVLLESPNEETRDQVTQVVETVRKQVRQHYDPAFSSRFSKSALESINEHLRNSTVLVVSINGRLRIMSTGK